MPIMPKMLKRLRRLTIFKVQNCKCQEFDHEGLFYHNGRGKKRWAAMVPPGGLQLNQVSFKNGVLEDSRLDFGGPRPRFLSIWKRFFEVLYVSNWDNIPEYQECQNAKKLPRKEFNRRVARLPRVGCGDMLPACMQLQIPLGSQNVASSVAVNFISAYAFCIQPCTRNP